MDKLLTAAEAADRLGIDASLVRRYCRSGRLPARQVGRDWIILPADLKGFQPRKRGRPAKKESGE